MVLADNDFIRVARRMLSGEMPATASALIALFVRHYGVEALAWDPITIAAEIEDDFRIELPSEVFDRLMSAISVVTNDVVYRSVAAFDETINAFNGAGLGTDEDIPGVDELLLTVAEIYLLDPEPQVTEREHGRWTHDIRKYCRVVLDDEGVAFSPRVLDFVPDRRPRAEQMDEPDSAGVAAAFEQQRASTAELNQLVERHVAKIAAELATLGIDLSNDD